MKIYIYCLLNNKDIPFYIGKTKNSLKIRESQHKSRLNKDLNIFELDYINEKDWKFWEKHYVSLYKSWGFILLNKNDGGGGLSFHTEESKHKMKNTLRPETSKKLKGIKRPDVSKRFKGKNLSQNTKDKIKNSKIEHECYKNPKRGEKIKTSNLEHYKKESIRNKKISSKLEGRKVDWVKTKPVLQYDKKGNFIKEWISATEAGKSLNKTSSAISECCNEKRKTAYKYIWKFKN